MSTKDENKPKKKNEAPKKTKRTSYEILEPIYVMEVNPLGNKVERQKGLKQNLATHSLVSKLCPESNIIYTASPSDPQYIKRNQNSKYPNPFYLSSIQTPGGLKPSGAQFPNINPIYDVNPSSGPFSKIEHPWMSTPHNHSPLTISPAMTVDNKKIKRGKGYETDSSDSSTEKKWRRTDRRSRLKENVINRPKREHPYLSREKEIFIEAYAAGNESKPRRRSRDYDEEKYHRSVLADRRSSRGRDRRRRRSLYRERDSYRDRNRDNDRDRDQDDRDGDRDEDRNKDSERDRDRVEDRNKDSERDRDRVEDRNKSRERDRNRGRDNDRDRDSRRQRERRSRRDHFKDADSQSETSSEEEPTKYTRSLSVSKRRRKLKECDCDKKKTSATAVYDYDRKKSSEAAVCDCDRKKSSTTAVCDCETITNLFKKVEDLKESLQNAPKINIQCLTPTNEQNQTCNVKSCETQTHNLSGNTYSGPMYNTPNVYPPQSPYFPQNMYPPPAPKMYQKQIKLEKKRRHIEKRRRSCSCDKKYSAEPLCGCDNNSSDSSSYDVCCCDSSSPSSPCCCDQDSSDESEDESDVECLCEARIVQCPYQINQNKKENNNKRKDRDMSGTRYKYGGRGPQEYVGSEPYPESQTDVFYTYSTIIPGIYTLPYYGCIQPFIFTPVHIDKHNVMSDESFIPHSEPVAQDLRKHSLIHIEDLKNKSKNEIGKKIISLNTNDKYKYVKKEKSINIKNCKHNTANNVVSKSNAPTYEGNYVQKHMESIRGNQKNGSSSNSLQIFKNNLMKTVNNIKNDYKTVYNQSSLKEIKINKNKKTIEIENRSQSSSHIGGYNNRRFHSKIYPNKKWFRKNSKRVHKNKSGQRFELADKNSYLDSMKTYSLMPRELHEIRSYSCSQIDNSQRNFTQKLKDDYLCQFKDYANIIQIDHHEIKNRDNQINIINQSSLKCILFRERPEVHQREGENDEGTETSRNLGKYSQEEYSNNNMRSSFCVPSKCSHLIESHISDHSQEEYSNNNMRSSFCVPSKCSHLIESHISDHSQEKVQSRIEINNSEENYNNLPRNLKENHSEPKYTLESKTIPRIENILNDDLKKEFNNSLILPKIVKNISKQSNFKYKTKKIFKDEFLPNYFKSKKNYFSKKIMKNLTLDKKLLTKMIPINNYISNEINKLNAMYINKNIRINKKNMNEYIQYFLKNIFWKPTDLEFFERHGNSEKNNSYCPNIFFKFKNKNNSGPVLMKYPSAGWCDKKYVPISYREPYCIMNKFCFDCYFHFIKNQKCKCHQVNKYAISKRKFSQNQNPFKNFKKKNVRKSLKFSNQNNKRKTICPSKLKINCIKKEKVTIPFIQKKQTIKQLNHNFEDKVKNRQNLSKIPKLCKNIKDDNPSCERIYDKQLIKLEKPMRKDTTYKNLSNRLVFKYYLQNNKKTSYSKLHTKSKKLKYQKSKIKLNNTILNKNEHKNNDSKLNNIFHQDKIKKLDENIKYKDKQLNKFDKNVHHKDETMVCILNETSTHCKNETEKEIYFLHEMYSKVKNLKKIENQKCFLNEPKIILSIEKLQKNNNIDNDEVSNNIFPKNYNLENAGKGKDVGTNTITSGLQTKCSYCHLKYLKKNDVSYNNNTKHTPYPVFKTKLKEYPVFSKKSTNKGKLSFKKVKEKIRDSVSKIIKSSASSIFPNSTLSQSSLSQEENTTNHGSQYLIKPEKLYDIHKNSSERILPSISLKTSLKEKYKIPKKRKCQYKRKLCNNNNKYRKVKKETKKKLLTPLIIIMNKTRANGKKKKAQIKKINNHFKKIKINRMYIKRIVGSYQCKLSKARRFSITQVIINPKPYILNELKNNKNKRIIIKDNLKNIKGKVDENIKIISQKMGTAKLKQHKFRRKYSPGIKNNPVSKKKE